ncbi:MAG: S41 family peptidase, partial [Verrucomicrobiota bacterium]
HFFKPKAILPLCLALFALFPVACGAQEAKPKPSKKDWGSIALRVVSIMEADHFAKVKFDDDMSARTLERYLDMLDGRKVYFTAEDVAEFESKYLEKIDDQVKKGDIPAADAIYSVFKERVKNRVAFAQKLVDDNNFTYDTDNHIAISRDEMPYAKQGAEYDQLWRNRIEGDMLREVLVDELADKKKAEEGEEAADDDEDERKPIAERVMKRYQEFEKLIFENDQDDIAAFFIKAITRSWDPHSEYYSQQDYENFRINMSKKLSGIGAMLKEHEDGTAIIDGLVVGGPAFKEGSLKPKDKIVGVGQGDEEIVDTIGKRLSDTVELIRGKVGTVVTLKVRPASASDPSETTLIKIVREEVDLKDNRATADLIVTKDPQGNEQKIGWLELPSFYSDMNGGDTSTTTDVRRVLSALKVRGIDGLVIDLRDNGGGALEEAINMTGLFIRKGPVVMSIDSKGGRDERNSRAARPAWDGPLVVLTNRASASASEIFAAALQDSGRAIVVGEVSTFGKGTVQQMRPVYTRPLNFFNRDANGQEGALKLTIQTFYRINGESTQLTGVVPDLRLPSIFDADEFGEGSLKHPMSVDPVKAAKYDAFFEGKLPIEAL